MSSQCQAAVKGPRIGVRHLQSLLLFLGLTVIHIARLNVSVAIVAMTNADSTNPNFPVSASCQLQSAPAAKLTSSLCRNTIGRNGTNRIFYPVFIGATF